MTIEDRPTYRVMVQAAAGVMVNEEVLQAGTFCQGLEQDSEWSWWWGTVYMCLR